MTTITFDSDIDIKKSHFKDLSDFGQYLLRDIENHQLHELLETEITDELRKKADKARKKPSSSFVNI